MAQNIPADLITYNGKIGPQYYDEVDGVMKPITKDILQGTEKYDQFLQLLTSEGDVWRV